MLNLAILAITLSSGCLDTNKCVQPAGKSATNSNNICINISPEKSKSESPIVSSSAAEAKIDKIEIEDLRYIADKISDKGIVEYLTIAAQYLVFLASIFFVYFTTNRSSNIERNKIISQERINWNTNFRNLAGDFVIKSQSVCLALGAEFAEKRTRNDQGELVLSGKDRNSTLLKYSSAFDEANAIGYKMIFMLNPKQHEDAINIIKEMMMYVSTERILAGQYINEQILNRYELQITKILKETWLEAQEKNPI